jgi:hypothetical protein
MSRGVNSEPKRCPPTRNSPRPSTATNTAPSLQGRSTVLEFASPGRLRRTRRQSDSLRP